MLGKFTFTNKIVARNLGIEEKRVEGVMEFVMDELNREILECNHPYLYVKGLGTFTLKSSTIDRRLKHLLKTLKGMKSTSREGQKEGLVEEIWELFRIRRLLKQRRQLNYDLRMARKGGNDSKGKLLSSSTEK